MPRTLVKRLPVAAAIAAVAWLVPGCAESKPVAGRSASAEQSAPAPRAALPSPGVQSAVQGVLSAGRHPWLTWPDFPYLRPGLQELYAAEPDGLFWFEDGRPLATLGGAVEMLGRADTQGLHPADYDAEPLAKRLAGLGSAPPTAADLAAFDLAVSITSARLLTAVHEGRIDPRTVGFRYDVSGRRLDVKTALLQAKQSGLQAAVDAASPNFPVYARLIRALGQYRALMAAGEPPQVPGLPPGQKKVAPGAAWDGAPALAERLRVLGDLPSWQTAPIAPVYGRDLVAAVKSFQERHALEADGVIGAATVEALNVSLADRVQQIELALERERWLPDTRTKPHVFVNVPLFRLWGYDPGHPDEPLRMNVVVGKSLGHATPVFIEEMEYVVFSPYWNPPPSIVRSEIVPKARRDAGYLARQNMEIVASGAPDAPAQPATPENLDRVLSGKLFVRQRPGPSNALGKAKFIFPNADSIYMHGTPAQGLFARARRDFSHGCIRLEDPAALAQWVLRDAPAWTRSQIDSAMAGDMQTQVNLKSPLTVMIFYDTAYVNSNGVLFFADDYYGHDAKLARALEQGYPYPRKD